MARIAPRWKAWTVLSAAALCVCATVGCEKLESSEGQSQHHVDDVARRALEKEEAQQPDLYGQAATDVAGKSDVATARARQLQAQAEYNAGTEMMRQASNQASVLAMRMIDINHLLSTIQTSSALVAGYGLYDSTPIKKQASAEITQIQGSASQDAWVAGAHPVPTLSAVKQTISRLEGEIRQKEDQIEVLSRQRVADLRKAEDLSEKADQSVGSAWVTVYKQASNLRRKAADISTHIDEINAAIVPLKVDLSIAQDDQKIAQVAIVGIRAQATGAEANFANIRHAVHAQDAVEKDVYQNAAAGQAGKDASLKGQLDALIDQYRQVQTSWDAATKLLSDSADHFAAAQSAAESLQVKLDQRAVEIPTDIPEKAAWDELKHIYSATSFQYDRGVSLQTLGMLCADQLSNLQELTALKTRAATILSAAKLATPAALNATDFDSLIAKATDTGKVAFSRADDLFQNVSNAPLASASQKNGGRVARVLELYGWYQFDVLTGDAQGASHLSAAHDAIKDAMDNNATLPMLPAEIEPRLALPASAASASPAGSAAAAASGSPADDATVAAIKQSAHDAVAAVQSGDAAKIKQFMIVPPEMAGAMDSMVALMNSSMKLQKALVAKFGDKGKAIMGGANGMDMDMPTPQQIDAMMSQAQFTATGPDMVSMAVAGSPQPIPLKKNGNEWAIDIAGALQGQPQAAAMMPMMTRMFQPMADGMNQLATDVDAGKYKNPGEVRTAMQQMMTPIMAQAMQGAAAAAQANAAGATTAPTAH